MRRMSTWSLVSILVLGTATWGWSQIGNPGSGPLAGNASPYVPFGAGYGGPISQLPGMGISPVAVSTASSGNFIMASTQLPTGTQQVVITDSAARTIAVYHVMPENGTIVLKSVRKIDADLGLEEFNGTDPLPSKVRGVVGSR